MPTTLVGCGGTEELDSLSWTALGDGAVREPIIGGLIDQDHAQVGRVGLVDRQGSERWFCSGTLVGPRTVLTAAHCVFDARGRRLRAPELAFSIEGLTLRSVRSAVTPDYAPGTEGAWDDAAVLTLEREGPSAPLAVATEPPIEGQRVRVVGYGVSHATGAQRGTGSGIRRRIDLAVERVEPRELTYWAGRGGACYGDSGGPLLVEVSGRWRVVGITSRGYGTRCDRENVATRADALLAWIRSASRRDACEGRCPSD